ncbi:MAG: argininosuccinate synthase [Campylobacterales bacterium]|nr:argininosuccinate synthase [Campylobacterales bacterium]
MKALALFSGGLDSLLAIKLITNQGVDVVALHFDIGFGGYNSKLDYLENAIKQVGATVEVIDIREKFIQEVLNEPKFGFGKNLNPCIDCHANMIKIAISLMEKFGASFIITGEVLGQRPMSQRKEALNHVLKLSEADDLVTRPLCAKLQKPSLAEKMGWIDREKLLDISGRGRSRQLQLAKEFGIDYFESPSGGCLLTDVLFSQRLKEHLDNEKFIVEDIELLKVGRHLRLPEKSKLIIGRHAEDNEKLEQIENAKYIKIYLKDIVGPLSVISSSASKDEIDLAMKLILSYTKAQKGEHYKLSVNGDIFECEAVFDKSEARKYFVIDV